MLQILDASLLQHLNQIIVSFPGVFRAGMLGASWSRDASKGWTVFCVCDLTQQRGLHRDADRQDVLVDQLDWPRPVRDLVVKVVGQPRSLQLQLLGLQGRLCRRLCGGKGDMKKKQLIDRV